MDSILNRLSQRQELPETAVVYVGRRENGERVDYLTVQEAVDAIPAENDTPVILYVLPGVYREAVRVSGCKPHIYLVGLGEKPEDVIITYDNYAGRKRENGDMTGTFRSATVSVYANHFTAENITFRNSFDGDDNVGGRQALAFYASGEHIVCRNCRFLGKQDTLYTRDGSQLYENCYIEGDVDFIFGGARAVFDRCTIRSLARCFKDPASVQGYVCAPSTYLAQKYGYVFRECTLESDCLPDTVYLGRPWHAGSDANAVGCAYFVRCKLGEHIKEVGWTDMGGFLGRNARFAEYKCEGPGAKAHPSRPVLSDEEAERLTNETVLGWNE